MEATTLAKDLAALMKEEFEERMEYEKTTVVTKQGETIRDLRRIFGRVENKTDWKKPFTAVVSPEEFDEVSRAVEFFHADKIEKIGTDGFSGFFIIRGHGYQA